MERGTPDIPQVKQPSVPVQETVPQQSGGFSEGGLTDEEVGIKNDPLPVPDKYATHPMLKEALDRGLREDFRTYYSAQVERITEEHDEPLLTEEKAFELELGFFVQVVDNVIKTAEEEPGRRTIVFFDVDETFGRVPHTLKKVTHPDYPDKKKEELSPQDQDLLGMLEVKDAYDRLVIRPAFAYAVNALHERYGSEVQFGILSTKAQAGMDIYLHAKLKELCPDAFSPELIMSCRDGAADELIPGVHQKRLEAVRQRRELLEHRRETHESIEQSYKEGRDTLPIEEIDTVEKINEELENAKLTFKDVIEGFLDTTPEGKTVIQERIVDHQSPAYTEALTDYDTKLLMLLRMLELSRKAGDEHFRTHYLDEVHAEEIASRISPETAFMLFDDAAQPVVLPHDSSLRYIQVKPKFFLPEDYEVMIFLKEEEKKKKLTLAAKKVQ